VQQGSTGQQALAGQQAPSGQQDAAATDAASGLFAPANVLLDRAKANTAQLTASTKTTAIEATNLLRIEVLQVRNV
jgi:hypothetical protein